MHNQNPRISDCVRVSATPDMARFEQDSAHAEALRAAIDLEEERASRDVTTSDSRRSLGPAIVALGLVLAVAIVLVVAAG